MQKFLLALALCAIGININTTDVYAARKSSVAKQKASVQTLAGHRAVVIHKNSHLDTESAASALLDGLKSNAGRALTREQMRDVAVLYLRSYTDNMKTAVHCENDTRPVELPLLQGKTKDYTAYEFGVTCVKPDGTRDGWSKFHTIKFWRSGGISDDWDCIEWHKDYMGSGMGGGEFVQISKLIARLEEIAHPAAVTPSNVEPVAVAIDKDLKALGIR